MMKKLLTSDANAREGDWPALVSLGSIQVVQQCVATALKEISNKIPEIREDTRISQMKYPEKGCRIHL